MVIYDDLSGSFVPPSPWLETLYQNGGRRPRRNGVLGTWSVLGVPLVSYWYNIFVKSTISTSHVFRLKTLGGSSEKGALSTRITRNGRVSVRQTHYYSKFVYKRHLLNLLTLQRWKDKRLTDVLREITLVATWGLVCYSLFRPRSSHFLLPFRLEKVNKLSVLPWAYYKSSFRF